MAGILYLCATPIGNLGDITLRVLETLKNVDRIAAEDTRNTIKLLNHYDIKKPLTSYHEHNKYERADELVELLLNGENIALVTDAGTPAISDPGEVLVQKCMEQGVCVTSLPGPCALITALTLSGMSARRFCFEGFLPADKKERTHVLESLKKEERTILLYEAPHHLKKTLEDLYKTLGDRKLVLCRELTKKFEEALPVTILQAIALYEKQEPRGEYVLVIAGEDMLAIRHREQEAWQKMSMEEHMSLYEEEGLDRKEAMKRVALDRGISKKEVYRALLPNEKDIKTQN